MSDGFQCFGTAAAANAVPRRLFGVGPDGLSAPPEVLAGLSSAAAFAAAAVALTVSTGMAGGPDGLASFGKTSGAAIDFGGGLDGVPTLPQSLAASASAAAFSAAAAFASAVLVFDRAVHAHELAEDIHGGEARALPLDGSKFVALTVLRASAEAL